MKKILIIVSLAMLIPVYAHAEQPQHEAGAIILKDIDKTTVFGNFTYTTLEHEKIKILNKRGVNDYCEVVLPYSTDYQKIEILDAKTITPEGKILKPGKKAINDVTPPFIVSAPIYSDIKYRTITMPGCTPESTIDYEVRITTIKPYMDNNFFDSDHLQTSDPIELSTYELSFPKDMKFNYRQYNFTNPPSIVENGNRVVYTWELKNIPQIIPEQNMPPMSDVSNRVAVSTVQSWDALAEWYWGLAGGQYETDPALDQKIRELIKGLSTRDEKIRAVYNYVSMNIRYVGIEFGIEGYKPHKAMDIFKNKYGDCKDHATLLIAMLKHIGVTAYPVLVDTEGIAKMDPTLPSPGQFDHEIVAIPQDNGFWFLDSTSDVTGYKDLPPMDQGRDVVIIQSHKAIIVKTPILPPQTNSIIDDRTVNIKDNDSINISMKLTYNGVYSMYEKSMLRNMKPIQRKSFIEETANAVCPGALVNSYDISDIYSLNIPVNISLDFTCQDYVIKAGDLLIVKVPNMSMENLSQIVARDKRTYPLIIGYNFEKKNIVTFNIPEGYRIRYMPDNTSYGNKFGSFTVSYKRLEKHLGYTGTMLSDAYSVQPTDYVLIKQLFNNAVITGKNQVVVFEKLKFKKHVVKHKKR
jgi:transglutaminase-like putative cysteine protease